MFLEQNVLKGKFGKIKKTKEQIWQIATSTKSVANEGTMFTLTPQVFFLSLVRTNILSFSFSKLLHLSNNELEQITVHDICNILYYKRYLRHYIDECSLPFEMIM